VRFADLRLRDHAVKIGLVAEECRAKLSPTGRCCVDAVTAREVAEKSLRESATRAKGGVENIQGVDDVRSVTEEGFIQLSALGLTGDYGK
jgi:hypothetical protein